MLAIYLQLYVPYLVLTLLCEINSVFLHARKLLSMTGANGEGANITSIFFYWFIWLLLFLTIIRARLGIHAFVLYLAVNDFMAARFHSFWVGIMAIAGMLIFNLLNLHLAYGTCRALWRDVQKLQWILPLLERFSPKWARGKRE